MDSPTRRTLTIPYRVLGDYVPIDIERLRPKESYRTLIANRTYAIERLVREHGGIPRDLLRERPCPTCGSYERTPEMEKDHLLIVRCVSCDLVYVNPVFDEEHYRETYGSTDYQRIMRDLGEASHDYRVSRFGSERVDIMARFLAPGADAPPRYLDVGCSTGFVVEAARDRGWRAEGLDLNPSAVEFGRARGLDLRVGHLDDGTLKPGAFDAVSLFDVLEHLPDPARTVTRCATLLRPGGILFLYVPNYDSASRMLMGADAHFIWPSHHLNYYTPVTITGLLERTGFAIEHVVTEGLDFVDYVWQRRELHGDDMAQIERIVDILQFLANAGAYGKNLRALARRPART